MDSESLCSLIDEHEKRVAELEAELARTVELLAAASAMATASADTTDELRKRVEQMEADLRDAAGELRIYVPEPGSVMAKLLSANVLLRRRVAELESELHEVRALLSTVASQDPAVFDLGYAACQADVVAAGRKVSRVPMLGYEDTIDFVDNFVAKGLHRGTAALSAEDKRYRPSSAGVPWIRTVLNIPNAWEAWELPPASNERHDLVRMLEFVQRFVPTATIPNKDADIVIWSDGNDYATVAYDGHTGQWKVVRAYEYVAARRFEVRTTEQLCRALVFVVDERHVDAAERKDGDDEPPTVE